MNIDSFNRLSLGIMENEKCAPKDAMRKLQLLKLDIRCNDNIRMSLPLQAALITSVNTAVRAFLGGVRVHMPSDVVSLLPWPTRKKLNSAALKSGTLNEIVRELGGMIVPELSENNFTLTFGIPASIDDNGLQVVCSDWQGGVMTNNEVSPFDPVGSLPVGGVFAGGYAVTQAFFRLSGMEIAAGDQSSGLSLWRPDLDWLNPQAAGPQAVLLPRKYWILGLGHLGQAYLWNIGLLPYADPRQVSILLQDGDRIVKANWSAGLLTTKKSSGQYKTRWCSRWLEQRGFKTILTERRFDDSTRRASEEPFVALCGFDTAESRLPLEDAGFDLVVEAGLGGNLALFDRANVHTFPQAQRSPREIWVKPEQDNTTANQVILSILQSQSKDPCGIIPITIAKKAVSASFVGACTGALSIAELLRGLHDGTRYDKISFQLRDLSCTRAIIHADSSYTTQHGRNGFLPVAAPARSAL